MKHDLEILWAATLLMFLTFLVVFVGMHYPQYEDLIRNTVLRAEQIETGDNQ